MLTVLVSAISSYSHLFSKNISVYAIFNDQSFNDTLTNDIVSLEQLGPGKQRRPNRGGSRMISKEFDTYSAYSGRQT